MQLPAWKAGLWAGLIAGAVYLVVLLVLLLAQGVSPLGTMRMTAAIVLGSGVLPPPPSFGMGIAAAALLVHFALSLVYGVLLALIIQRLERMPALGVGVAFGLAMWLLDYYLIAPGAFPWFAGERAAPATPFLHVVFGIAAVGGYLAIAARERRAGLERRQHEEPVAAERRKHAERRGPV